MVLGRITLKVKDRILKFGDIFISKVLKSRGEVYLSKVESLVWRFWNIFVWSFCFLEGV